MNENQKIVAYWLGYKENPPAIQSLPSGIDVINLFLLNLSGTVSDTTLDYSFITSKGTSWDVILDQAHQAQKNGVKVCVSIIPPNGELIWNNIQDPEKFASNVYGLIQQWGLDGIDIDPEQGGGVDNENFIAVIKALSKYFGPQSNTGLILSFVTYQLFNDQPVLEKCAAMFDYFMLMGYFWDFESMTSQFYSYSKFVGSENLLFGVGGDPWQTPKSEIIQLSSWEPENGSKGGMMVFNINEDPSIIKILR